MEKELRVQEKPSDLQKIIANENAELIKKFGGECDGFMFDVNGWDVYAVTLNEDGSWKYFTISLKKDNPMYMDFDLKTGNLL
jgi:hypothetical protein